MNIGIGRFHDSPSPTESPKSSDEALAKGQPQTDKTTAQPSTSSGVSLDGSTRLHQQMAASAQQGAPLDVENIERLRSAIQTGEYTVDLRGLASKLIAKETEVFGR